MIQKRNYGLDLLKIISMLMVILLHVTTYGIKNIQCTPLSLKWFDVSIIRSFCYVAVNCFVLISGYFMCQKKFKIDRLLKLWCSVIFYSVTVYIISIIVPSSGMTFSFKELLKRFMPLMTSSYWFFNSYFVLMILSPFLNKLIQSMSKEELKRTVIVLITIFAIIPTFDFFSDPFYSSYGYSFVWFVVLYMISAYIRVSNFDIKNAGMVYFLCAGAEIIINVIYQFPKNEHIRFFFVLQTYYNSIFVLLGAISLFCFFRKLDIKNIKLTSAIKWVVPKSFAVYLIHEHPLFRDILWSKIIKMERFDSNAITFLLAFIISTIVIFSISILIEALREKFFNKVEKKVIDNIQLLINRINIING